MLNIAVFSAVAFGVAVVLYSEFFEYAHISVLYNQGDRASVNRLLRMHSERGLYTFLVSCIMTHK